MARSAKNDMLPVLPWDPPRLGRRRLPPWLAGLVLIGLVGLVIHPVVHQTPNPSCTICLVAQGHAPLPPVLPQVIPGARASLPGPLPPVFPLPRAARVTGLPPARASPTAT